MRALASERLAAARAHVDGACELLLSPTPQQMDECSRLLQAAISEIIRFCGSNRPALPVSPPATPVSSPGSDDAALEQARLLQTSIGRATRLLESAAAFYTNWIRYLSALCGGYTGQGQPAALERGARLLARG